MNSSNRRRDQILARQLLATRTKRKQGGMRMEWAAIPNKDKNGNERIDEWAIMMRSFPHNDNQLYMREDGQFRNAEFMVLVKDPKNFPEAPPDPTFLTPTGIYQTNANICVSIGKFHSGSWKPVLGMSGFIDALTSCTFFYENLGNGGIGIITHNINPVQRKEFADRSARFNEKKFKSLRHDLLEIFAERDETPPLEELLKVNIDYIDPHKKTAVRCSDSDSSDSDSSDSDSSDSDSSDSDSSDGLDSD